MLLFIIIAAIIIILVGFLIDLKVTFRIHINPQISTAYFDIHYFYGLFKSSVTLRLINRRGEQIRLVRVLRGGRERVLLPKQNNKKTILTRFAKNSKGEKLSTWLSFIRLNIYLRIGTGSPDTDCLICGVAKELPKYLELLLRPKEKITAETVPDFTNKLFILNLTGILQLHHVKIILITLKSK